MSPVWHNGARVKFLDRLGAPEALHKEIVALVAGPGGVSSAWWQQSVAVGYEQARGLRVPGQRPGADEPNPSSSLEAASTKRKTATQAKYGPAHRGNAYA